MRYLRLHHFSLNEVTDASDSNIHFFLRSFHEMSEELLEMQRFSAGISNRLIPQRQAANRQIWLSGHEGLFDDSLAARA